MDFAPLLKLSPFVISLSEVWLCVVLVMVSSVSLWSLAKGFEVVISGKLRAQRAKAMKFRDGYLISTGEPKKHYIDAAVRHVAMRQGMLGVRVTIMLAHDPEGKMGPKMPMPDNVVVLEPKEDAVPMAPSDGGYQAEYVPDAA